MKVRKRMIIGVGTDIAEIERFEKLLSGERAEAFAKRVLTAAEQKLAIEGGYRKHRYIEYVSGRWAAKEAVVKALGCGIGGSVGFPDIEVLPDESGKPACTISEAAWNRLGYGEGSRSRPTIHVSITHSGGLAAAFAVAEDKTND